MGQTERAQNLNNPETSVQNTSNDDLSVSEIISRHAAGLDAYFVSVPPDNMEAVVERERRDGTPEFLYPEATGYAILNLLFLFDWTLDRKYLERAHRCANWIISKEVLHEKEGGVRARFFDNPELDEYTPDQPQQADYRFQGWCLCVFDTAICLEAISALYRADPDNSKDYKDPLEKMAGFVEEMLNERKPIYHVNKDGTNGFVPDDTRWSMSFGPYLMRAAAALIRYSTGVDVSPKVRQQLEYTARQTCSTLANSINTLGYFETTTGQTDLHAHCYAVEGLLTVWQALDAGEFKDKVEESIEWGLDRWTKEGKLAQLVDWDDQDKSINSPRNDALAQLLLLGTEFWRVNKDFASNANTNALKKLYSYLIRQCRSGKALNLDKSFHEASYYSYGYISETEESSTLTSWGNFFIVESLVKYNVARLIKRSEAIVLAGGRGTRAWPLSWQKRPKALVHFLLADRSPLKETILRLSKVVLDHQIKVTIGGGAKNIAQTQAREIKMPHIKVVPEECPNGSLSAVKEALLLVKQEKDTILQDKDTLLIVAMADDFFDPPENFTKALDRAIVAAYEDPCIVSIGKPIESLEDSDERFGHMVYSPISESYPLAVYQVEHFAEKPTVPSQSEGGDDHLWQTLAEKAKDKKVAFECGTLVMRRSTYDNNVRDSQEKDFATLLHKAFNTPPKTDLPYKVAPLPEGTTFEDLGSFGPHLFDLFKNNKRLSESGRIRLFDEKMDRKGNLCLSDKTEIGEDRRIRLLACDGCVVIADGADIHVYGLKDHLIVNSKETQAAVIVPLSDATETTAMLLEKSPKKYQEFVNGKSGSLSNLKKLDRYFEIGSPGCKAYVSAGFLATAYCRNLVIRRDDELLSVHNELYPKLEDTSDDFFELSDREGKEPKLVGHLVDVARLADGILNTKNPHGTKLIKHSGSESIERCLRIACLYHDFGGTLDPDNFEEEKKVRDTIGTVSNLDPSMLDSRILLTLIKGGGVKRSRLWRYIDDSMPSTIKYLSTRDLPDPSTGEDNVNKKKIERDIITLVLATQERPEVFKNLLESISNTEMTGIKQDIQVIYGCLKTADNLVAGRWRWKRTQGSSLLRGPETELEDFASICAYTSDFLKKAEIDPKDYIEAMLHSLDVKETDSPGTVQLGDSVVTEILKELQDNSELWFADRLFLYWYSFSKDLEAASNLRPYLDTLLLPNPTRITKEQLRQVLMLPENLGKFEGAIKPKYPTNVKVLGEAIICWAKDKWEYFEQIPDLENVRQSCIKTK